MCFPVMASLGFLQRIERYALLKMFIFLQGFPKPPFKKIKHIEAESVSGIDYCHSHSCDEHESDWSAGDHY